MAKRKVGNNKRQPRTAGGKSQCISIMPDGSAAYFTPKPRAKRSTIVKLDDGSYIVNVKERALL